jgi:3-hydroxymyristoyl/3-hydroxydecanoyl-(acyl carrier protein) dehydratase
MSSIVLEHILDKARSAVAGGGSAAFPLILSHAASADDLHLTLDIKSDLDCFRGHFPGNPVLPGVVQLHWAVAIGMAFFGYAELPTEILRLKFKAVIVPPTAINLALTRTVPSDIRFEYSAGDQQYSLGMLRFAGIRP